MADRRETLLALLGGQLPLEEIATRLRDFEWDSVELVQLRAEHVAAVLRRFVDGDLGAADVHAWADLVEGRDDVGFDPAQAEGLKRAIFQLANPEMNEPLTKTTAEDLLRKLGG